MDPFCYLCLVSVILSYLFIAAFWTPPGKSLTSWLSCVMLSCVLSFSHVVSWVRYRTWVYRFLFFAIFLTLNQLIAQERQSKIYMGED